MLLRPFRDKSRAVVAVWLTEYCVQFLAALHAFSKPHDVEFPQEKVLCLVNQHVSGDPQEGQLHGEKGVQPIFENFSCRTGAEEGEEKVPGTQCFRMRVIIAKATW